MGDNFGSFATAAEVSGQAPVSGTYTILVSQNLNHSQQNVSGNYIVTVAKTPGPYFISTGDEGGPMTSGLNHTGLIRIGDLDTWIFHVTAGNSISLTLTEVAGGPDPNFVPRLRLIGPDGVVLNDVNGNSSAQISRTVPLTGVYTVLVSHNPNTNQSGTGNYTLAFTGPPQPALSINNVTQNEGNDGTTPFNFNVTLSSPVTQAVNVNYATALGTATVPSDYTAISSALLTFNPGELSKTVTVFVNADTVLEPDETFFVNLSGAALVVNTANPQGIGTIINDDSTIQFSSATYNVNENGGNASIIATRAGSNTGIVSAVCSTSNGTAFAGQDYTSVSSTLSWIDGDSTSKTCSVPIVDDSVFEGNETVNLNLGSPTGGSTIGTPSTAVLTIVDNETQPTISIVNTIPGAEPSTANVFAVTLSGQTTSQVTVQYATANGTATAGSDYTATSGTLTFAASTTTLTQTISVPTLDDLVFEGPETFTILLSAPTNTTISGPNPAIGTITDNEVQPTISIVNTTPGAEPATANVFTVTLSGQTTQDVTVQYATANGTATAGSDYTATSGTLTFGANTTTLTQTINVPTLDDLVFEGPENFTILLSAPTNTTIAGINPAIGTLTDNETQPNLSINNVTENEGNSGTTPFNFTVSLSGPTTQTVSVNYATADGTATAPSDYNALPSIQLTFGPGELIKTVTVLVNGDTIIEPDETFVVNLSGVTNATLLITQGTGTIRDDDTATLVGVSGRVTTPSGLGLRNAVVTLTDSQGVRRTATTSSFGFYSFDNVPTGQNYIIGVSSKRYRFAARSLNVTGNMTDVDFVGLE